MDEILKFLNEYSSLINFTLFATIIAILINLTRISKEVLEDKHRAELAVLNAKIAGLESENKHLQIRLTSSNEQSESKLVLLKYQLEFFQRISDMPDDKRVEAIKHHYETRIRELEEQAKTIQSEMTEDEREKLQEEIQKLRKESKEFIKIDRKVIDSVLELASKVYNLLAITS